MSMMFRTTALIGLALFSLGSTPAAAAEGCACEARPANAVHARSHYQSVFAGRVSDVREQDGKLLVTFAVGRSWKGPRGETIAVSTPRDGCGVAFEAGRDYLVFASGERDALTTDTCGTSELSVAGSAIHQLNLNGGFGNRPLVMPTK